MKTELNPIFILDCTRSGTTMLADLLSRHYKISFVPEVIFKFPLLRKINKSKTKIDTEDLISLIKKHPESSVYNSNLELDFYGLDIIDNYQRTKIHY